MENRDLTSILKAIGLGIARGVVTLIFVIGMFGPVYNYDSYSQSGVGDLINTFSLIMTLHRLSLVLILVDLVGISIFCLYPIMNLLRMVLGGVFFLTRSASAQTLSIAASLMMVVLGSILVLLLGLGGGGHPWGYWTIWFGLLVGVGIETVDLLIILLMQVKLVTEE